MVEEKKGHAKITVEIELNEALMEIIKEGMKNMPQMGGGMMRRMMPGRNRESEQFQRHGTTSRTPFFDAPLNSRDNATTAEYRAGGFPEDSRNE